MVGKIRNYCLLLSLIVIILTGCSKGKVSLKSLLKEMTSRENLTRFPIKGYTHHQFSSYNRASVSPGNDSWFANYDMSHFIRVEENMGRREFVMFDANGPGAVVRWWMTFYRAQNGILRVYVDEDSIPVIHGKPSDILRGKSITCPPLAVAVQEGAPLGEEGRDYDHNFYVPIPFSKHCKITYECDSLVMRYENEGIPVPEGYYWPDVFYNIEYRAYSKGVRVKSLTKRELELAGPRLFEAGAKLLENKVSPDIVRKFDNFIFPGDSLVLEFGEKEHAINRFLLKLSAGNIPQSLRSTIIQASFDGHRTVWLPVGEFFGSGYSQYPHKTFMNEVDEKGEMESFWVMPFRDKCVLELINYGRDTLLVSGMVELGNYKWSKGSMYFGAAWHEYYHLGTRDEKGSHFDLNFINIKGKGVYAGDQVTLYNNTYEWWGEGDEKIFVDGEPFPSSFGTGSEDYYGYSFARQEPFSHPFISQPVGTGNMSWGPTVNMRHRSLDAIPFSSSISSNIELWHWADIKMNYALTSFFYILPPFTLNIYPDIESVKRPVVLSKIDFTLDEK
jgi:hypothetical protein